MSTTFLSQKNPKTAFWTEVEASMPKDDEAMFLVVQNSGGTQSLGFSWYRKNGDGIWSFNKPDVTHWAPAPKFPGE